MTNSSKLKMIQAQRSTAFMFEARSANQIQRRLNNMRFDSMMINSQRSSLVRNLNISKQAYNKKVSSC